MYDNARPVLGLQYRNTANDVLASFNYTLDSAGNRIAVDDLEGHSAFGYDQLDRLVSASYPDGTSESFEMDLSGNRIRHSDAEGVTEYVLDQGDRLLSTTGAKPATYTWDDNGNMASKETPDGTTLYTWDSRDKLVQVQLPTGATNQYRYYPLSDLRLKTVDQAGEEKFFLYDGQNVLEELDPYNGSLARYVEGVGVDEHIARVENGQVHAYVGDPLGTVRAVVDAGGNVVNEYAYQAYGGFRSRSESVANPYMFTGRRFDADTGEYYYRARYYQPGLGRFSAADPLAPVVAVFGYAENNPLSFVDPTGLLVKFASSDKMLLHNVERMWATIKAMPRTYSFFMALDSGPDITIQLRAMSFSEGHSIEHGREYGRYIRTAQQVQVNKVETDPRYGISRIVGIGEWKTVRVTHEILFNYPNWVSDVRMYRIRSMVGKQCPSFYEDGRLALPALSKGNFTATTLVHELAHVAGYEHASEPTNNYDIQRVFEEEAGLTANTGQK